MTTQQFRVHISADGVIDPIPNWTGGEMEVLVMPNLQEPTMTQRKEAGRRFFETWDGVLANSPEMTVDEIRTECLENEDVFWPNPTDEQLDKMYEVCRGCLEGVMGEEYDQMREERILGKR